LRYTIIFQKNVIFKSFQVIFLTRIMNKCISYNALIMFLGILNPFDSFQTYSSDCIIYLKHYYIKTPNILNTNSIYHFKMCKSKHSLHMILVIFYCKLTHNCWDVKLGLFVNCVATMTLVMIDLCETKGSVFFGFLSSQRHIKKVHNELG